MLNAPDSIDLNYADGPISPRMAGAVHDFNNLLSVIMVCADEIAAAPGGGPERERAEEIRAAASRGAELIRQLLAPDRPAPGPANAAAPEAPVASEHAIGAGPEEELDEREREPAVKVTRTSGSSPAPPQLDVAAAIATALPVLERTLGPDVIVRDAVDGALPPVQLTADVLERVLLNLATNSRAAFESSADGRGSVVLQASMVAVREGDPMLAAGWYVRIAFADDGGGMDFEVAARALEPGFSTKPEGGTGLGLSIVRQIVREAGGDVRLNTTPGVGTTVTVYVPAAPAEAGTETPPAGLATTI